MSQSEGCSATLLPALGDPTSRRLANGVDLVSLVLPEAPLVCLDFWCRAGSVFETAAESGMAHFLEHMVFKGSEHLAPGEFDWRIEALGGSSNAATGFDDVHYHLLINPEAAPAALELLLQLVLTPRLEAQAFAMERQVVLEELAQSEDQPEEVALQRLLELACPGHPYSRPILGRRESLVAHGPEAMATFHHRLYGGGRCVLAFSGAVDPALVELTSQGPLAELLPCQDPDPLPDLELQPGVHRLVVPRLEAARLLMAWWQPPARDLEAVMGADLATTVLAEGRRSRLVERLREELRLVESIDLDLHAMECGSLALLEAVCAPEDLGPVRAAITTVWEDVMERPLAAEEWERAHRLVSNSYRFGLESASGVAGLIGSSRLWGRQPALAAPLEMLRRWTPVRLREEALSSLNPHRACVLEAVPQ
ncbi:MAG: pitrilysin family protein [Cyanobacteriota bacterium]|nr:pitrilysin family protein [Cyanobacteriota bacterium]